MLVEPVPNPPRRRPPYGIYAYTGREWDPEIGLYYYRARYYDPKVGRFISEDPLGFAAGPNFYGYVDGNPIVFTDPSGLFLDGATMARIAARTASRTAAGWTAAAVEPTPGGEAAMALVTIALVGWDLYNAIEKGENYITVQVKERCQETEEDPCDVLREMMRQAKKEKNTKKIQDIKKAEKYLGCRRSRQSR